MIKYCLSAAYRKHYSDLEKLKMLSQSLQIEPYDIGQHILKAKKQNAKKGSKSPSKQINNLRESQCSQAYFEQLIESLQVFKNIALTPIKIFKSLLLIHCCFLLVKSSPNDNNISRLNQYFKWILEQAVKMIEKISKKETKKNGTSKIGSSFSKNNETTYSDLFEKTRSSRSKTPQTKSTARPKSTSKCSGDQILSKQLCLLSTIIKPYILYLQKILSIYSHYQNLLHSIPSTLQTSEQSAWTILNLFKLMSAIVGNFNHIGRYFYKQYSPLVFLLIQFFSKQVSRLYPKIAAQAKKKISTIQHQWFVLLEQYSEYEIFHNQQIQIEGVDKAMMLVDQIVKINDSLYHIYLGKYFYLIVQRLKLPEPKWFQIHSKQCEFLLHYNQMKYKNGRRKSIRQSSKNARSTSFSRQKLSAKKTQSETPKQYLKPFSDITVLNSQQKQISSKLNLPRSEPISCQIVIQKRNLIPKVRNALKLGNQKQNKQKQETITFRLKQIKQLNASFSFMDQSTALCDQRKIKQKELIKNSQKTILNYENLSENQKPIETMKIKVNHYQVVDG